MQYQVFRRLWLSVHYIKRGVTPIPVTTGPYICCFVPAQYLNVLYIDRFINFHPTIMFYWRFNSGSERTALLQVEFQISPVVTLWTIDLFIYELYFNSKYKGYPNGTIVTLSAPSSADMNGCAYYKAQRVMI